MHQVLDSFLDSPVPANVLHIHEQCSWISSAISASDFFIFPFTSNAQTNNCFLIHFSFHQVILRSTELKERPLAMALSSVTFRVLGGIPAPLLFGFGLDKLCLIHASCDAGNCLLPDNQKVKYLTLIMSAIFKSLSFIFLLISWLLYKRNQEKAKGAALL